MNTNNEWKLLPVVPTEEMHVAAVRTIANCSGNDDFPPRVYAGMLAAAPEAPPLTVTVDPDPRGVSVGVWQGPRCVYNGAHPIPASTVEGDAQDERQADACPRCDGSGEITVMSDNSPDAHNVVVCCDHCQGSGSAVDAAKYLAAALAGEKYRHMQIWAEYRNFHRSLCARFGYGHDEIHFRRDLVSLEEAIAAKVAAPAAGDAQDLTLAQKYEDACIAANANERDAARYRLAVADCILVLRGDAALGRAEWDSKLDELAKTKGAT